MTHRLSTLEKINILKRASIFAEVADATLAEVAALIEGSGGGGKRIVTRTPEVTPPPSSTPAANGDGVPVYLPLVVR